MQKHEARIENWGYLINHDVVLQSTISTVIPCYFHWQHLIQQLVIEVVQNALFGKQDGAIEKQVTMLCSMICVGADVIAGIQRNKSQQAPWPAEAVG